MSIRNFMVWPEDLNYDVNLYSPFSIHSNLRFWENVYKNKIHPKNVTRKIIKGESDFWKRNYHYTYNFNDWNQNHYLNVNPCLTCVKHLRVGYDEGSKRFLSSYYPDFTYTPQTRSKRYVISHRGTESYRS